MFSDRKIRKAQTLSPFGVGAIFDYRDESFIAMDVSRWSTPGTVIECTRLSRKLRNLPLRGAPRAGVPYMRFPRWLTCRRCSRMTHWRPQTTQWQEPGAGTPQCGHPGCSGHLIPIRFVMACTAGHLSDVPWDRWVHLGQQADNPDQANCDGKELVFRSMQGAGGGLESLYVECRTCHRRRTLDRLMRPDGLRGIRCRGGQPWYSHENRDLECTQDLKVVQRGATNLYTPNIVTALDIPPEANYDPTSAVAADIRSDPTFPALQTQLQTSGSPLVQPLANVIARNRLTPEQQSSPAQVNEMISLVLTVASEQTGQPSAAVTNEDEDLLIGEWHALTVPPAREAHPLDRFQAEHTTLLRPDTAPPAGGSLDQLNTLINQVVLVRRLREVRALESFSRLGLGEPRIPVGRPDRQPDFLPALEVYGEGIFLSLHEDALKKWQDQNVTLIERQTGILQRRLGDSTLSDQTVTPRFLVLHTLAHLLIRQLAFEAGYSSSALRERIYSAEPGSGSGAMAGVLIYTAAGDQEGTLGGLVRLGEPPYLAGTLLNALAAAQWCSADPVCSESAGQGSLGLNLAACHACTLVSETSCTHRNLLLDRTLVLGNAAREGGFFSGVLASGMLDFTGDDHATPSL